MSAECRADEMGLDVAERSPPIADAAHMVVPRHLKTDEPISVAWHAHHEGLLFAVVSGLATMRTDAGTWTMLPRQIGWLPPGTRHCGHSFGKAEALFLYVRQDVCRTMPKRPCVLRMSALAHALMERLAQVPEKACPGLDPGWTPVFRKGHAPNEGRAGSLPLRRVEQMLAVLLDDVREASEVPLHLPLPRDPRLQHMAQALSSAPDDDTDLDGWAISVGISRRTLIRRFQQETGLNIGQWRQQLRLMKALELLAEGDSVTTAALSVGYSSVSAFIACFRQRFGVTPTKYFSRDAR